MDFEKPLLTLIMVNLLEMLPEIGSQEGWGLITPPAGLLLSRIAFF